MSSEGVKTKTEATHRPYDEACKRAAVAQWQSGVPARRVHSALGYLSPVEFEKQINLN